MEPRSRKIAIIGAGIAGLCTAVYALKCGYQVEILEMSEVAGGLAMSWRREPYTFETCLHWLVGSKPGGDFHEQWREVFDIERLTFVDPDEFIRLESADGESLSMYTDVERLEAELLRRSPQDANAIHELILAVRTLGRFRTLDPAGGITQNWRNLLRDLPTFPLVGRLSKISGAEYGKRFADPLLRSFFSSGDIGRMPAIAIVLTLAWMNSRNAAYCIGGSQSIIRLIVEKITNLGGTIRFNSRVTRIVVNRGDAVGVRLANGETILADWIVSAADGHSTIFDLLSGEYVDDPIRRRFDNHRLFASYLQVSLGIRRDLKDQRAMFSRLLEAPLHLDPGTDLDQTGFRIFHFDPTFAPPGRTAVTSLLPTRNHEYWRQLRNENPTQYRAEKHRIAQLVIDILDRRIPGVRPAIEIVDVSTPATVVRYTGNWKGSMEGWLLEPGAGFRPFPNTLPGLNRFLMVGQWVMPGGGLPCGPLTGRPAVKFICKHDHVPFLLQVERAAVAA